MSNLFSSLRFMSPSIVIVICIAVFLLPAGISDTLIFKRELIPTQAWRFITANFMHTNGYHLLINMGGVLLIWALHQRHFSNRKFALLLLICAAGSTLGIWLFSPTMSWYVGLSGALHGVIVFGALCDIQQRDRTGYLLLVGIIGKVCWEQIYHQQGYYQALIEANVAVDAHLYGFISGGLLFALFMLKKRAA